MKVKIRNYTDQDIEAIVVGIVGRHATGFDGSGVRVRASSGGKWLAVTVTIEAQSRAQLDAIYDTLTAHDKVLMRL